MTVMASAAFWLLVVSVCALSAVLAVVSGWARRALGSFFSRKNNGYESGRKRLSGPRPLPLIGSLHKLAGDGGPFEAFTRMAKVYGDIYSIKLGVADCVIVSSYPLIKEVLITKGGHFGGRPNFLRFHALFGGDRNNSLALCDWSDLQRKRRSIARSFCSPRGGSLQQEELSRVAVNETKHFLELLSSPQCASILRGESPVKPVILAAMGNMFTHYMCSMRFGYSDELFNKVVGIFDDIFWDINQGYAVDFLPWLGAVDTRPMNRLNNWAIEIRSFILKEIIEPRRESLDRDNEVPRDFTDALLLDLESDGSQLSWDHIIFELEDFLGGHSAVGNLVMMVLANAVTYPEVQKKMQLECDTVLREKYNGNMTELLSLNDRADMVYTEAVIWETLRVSSSPIVPHVATCDSEINGYPVPKDTVVFLNNYDLNLGESYWGDNAKEFYPERFLKETVKNGAMTTKVVKPEHFIPFSTGKRTCIGQKLVQGFAFVVLSSLLSRYDISAPPGVDVMAKMKPSCVAVPSDCFNLVFTPRESISSTDGM